MTLYSENGGYPKPLPFRIRVNGKTRTDPETFTPEEIASAGFVEVAEPNPPEGKVAAWSDGTWTYEDAPFEFEVLSPSRFAFMLAVTGLKKVWEDVQSWAEQNDPDTFALLYGYRFAAEFHFSKTMNVIDSLRPVIDVVAPGAALEEETIRTAWEQAAKAPI